MPKIGRLGAVTIAGPLCFAGDIMAREVPLPPVEAGRLDRDSRCGGLHAEHVVAALQPRHSGGHWVRSAAGQSASHVAPCGNARGRRAFLELEILYWVIE